MGTEDQIRTATWDDEPRIGALMALAFASDPFVRWVNPDPLVYINKSQKHAKLSSGPAFDNGSVYVIGDVFGAALWLPPNTKISRPLKDNLEKQKSGSDVPEEFVELMEKSAAYCPKEPHWYLSLIVVDPAHRGKGYGEALMKHALEICDRDNLPTYLESTNAANLSLYCMTLTKFRVHWQLCKGTT